jgi:hypothetical protein
MPVLEKDIENKVTKIAKREGWMTRKMNGLGNRSWPDRLYISPEGRIVWIEFKRPDGALSEGQKALIDDLRLFKQSVFVCYSVEEGLHALGIKNG